MESSGPTAENTQNLDPRSRRLYIQPPDLNAKKGGLEHEKARSGREGGKRRAQGLKKRTYSRTETVIQTPPLGARTRVWNIEKVESCAPNMGRSGPTAENPRNLDPRSLREKGGLERE